MSLGVYSRWLFPRLCDFFLDRPQVAERRRRLLSHVSGKVLEIGFGTGLNLACYPEHVGELTVVEPNGGMLRRARRRIELSKIDVASHRLGGERLPFADGSFECVVSTFTLCSIEAVSQALAEIYRVLAPGGQFLFLEHGLSPDFGVQRWQRRLTWLERILADNCRLDRDMRVLVTRESFAMVELETYYLENTPRTHGYLFEGRAKKPENATG